MWNRWKTRENVKQVETTGKHVTSGKRGKTLNIGKRGLITAIRWLWPIKYLCFDWFKVVSVQFKM